MPTRSRCDYKGELIHIIQIEPWPLRPCADNIRSCPRCTGAVFVSAAPACCCCSLRPASHALTRLERCERRASRRRPALGRFDQHPLAHAEHEDLVRAAHAEAASIDVRALPVLLDVAQERGGRRLLAALLLQPLLAEQPADLGGMRRRLPRCRGAEVQRCRDAEVQRCRGAGRCRGRRGCRGCRGRSGLR